MRAISKVAMAGFVAKKLGAEVGQRAAQKIPGVNLFVPQTKSQKVGNVGRAVHGTAAGGRAQMASARAGNVSSKTLGSNRKPVIDKEVTASLIDVHRDMLELEKEAKGMPGIGNIFGGAATHAAAGLMMVGGLYGASKLHSKMETENIWKRLQRENPELTRGPKDRENFEVLQRFSPDIAGNVTTARSYLQRAQQTYMAPHEFVKDLASIQDTRNKGSLSYQLQDVAKQSIGTGIDFAQKPKKASADKNAALIAAMNSVYDR